MKSDLSAANQKITENTVSPFLYEMWETVFSHVQEGLLIFDPKGNLLRINPEGLLIHGLAPADEEHLKNNRLSFFRVFDNEHRELPPDKWPVKRLLDGESFSNETYIVKVKENGPEIGINYSCIPQFDKTGNFVAGVLFARRQPEQNVQAKLTNEVIAKEEQLTELEVYQQQLKDDRELLQTIIDTIPVMISIYDKRIHSFRVNRAFEQITGWTSKEFNQDNLMELVYPDSAYRKEISEYMKSLQPGFKDITMRTRHGREIETSWANVKIPDGRQVGVGIDISERKRLEKELIKARERAEKENQVQYDFIQNISHEVRTPMNSILGFTELLQSELSGKKEAEFLNAISQNGKQLLRLIDDIIDFSRLDNNQISIQKEEVNIDQLMEQIELQMEGIKKAYKKRNLKLFMTLPDSYLRAKLNTDGFRLQQVLLNLIGNAIKYTEKGHVEVGYEIRQETQDVLFYVKDTGIGIDPHSKNKVFRRFNRLHNTHSHEFRGTGLGLVICKHLVNLLGGEIWFKSKPGNGTVFYFNHPYQELENTAPVEDKIESQQPEGNEEVSLPDLSQKVILIVEDDSFSYMMMYHMLEETKAVILHADTGRKAVELFDKYQPDLVFLDIRLPEMDGYQVIHYMHQVNSSIPVIAQTANALPEDRKKIKDAGFSAHITKPLSRESLFHTLYKLI